MMVAAKGSRASREVDEQLARYRSMRDFGLTAEPEGSGARKPGVDRSDALPFVIQKHAATRLHYDFRLGWRGVLKSWACAKGPSYATADKRLAVQVEDHPMEYGGFEGTIPKGQYGGGTVLIWDQGRWQPEGDVDEGLERGSLKFSLHGTKLNGKWALVRMGGRAANEAKPNWLLIKEHDGQERGADAAPITEEAPDSVVTGRSLEQVAAAADHVWQSHAVAAPKTGRARLQERLAEKKAKARPPARQAATAWRRDALRAKTPNEDTEAAENVREKASTKGIGTKSKQVPGEKQKQSQLSTSEAWLDSAPEEAMPGFIPPQLAAAAEILPAGGGWLYELKLDGYRVQAHLQALQGKGSKSKKPESRVQLRTRNGLDWTARMPTLAAALAKLPVQQAVLDGELVVLDREGLSDFGALQEAFEQGGSSAAAQTMKLYLFDLLHLNGRNTRVLPLSARRPLLRGVMDESDGDLVAMSEALGSGAATVLAEVCAAGAEGIVCKQSDAPYVSGRSERWRKVKCLNRQEFVIAGFTLPRDGGPGVGALLLGFYDNDRGGRLVYCGRCGTGWDRRAGVALRKELGKLVCKDSPVDDGLSAAAGRGVQWVEPEVCCEVQFAAMTRDGKLRHASFQGLRRDKAAREIVLEARAAGSSVALPAAGKAGVNADAKEGAGAKAKVDEAASTQGAGSGSRTARGTGAGSARTKPKHPELTHPDKVVDSESGVTKRQLANYFVAVAEAMLPHLVGRPASLVRCPGGVGKPCFFQKHAAKGTPASIGSLAVADKHAPGKTEPYLVLESEAALVAAAQLGTLEIHPWGARAPELERPDRLIFDLDPDESLEWGRVVDGALAIRDLLKELGLESFVKTTGGKGLHVVTALEPALHWDQLRLFARGVAAAIESTEPKRYLTKMSKAARKGRIFIDWMRNERGATAIAAWSPRARAGMRVAMPLEWTELADGLPTFAVANLDDWRDRLKTADTRAGCGLAWDPWAAMQPQRVRTSVLESVLQAAQTLEGRG